MTEEEAAKVIEIILKALNEYADQEAIAFAEWKEDNHWISAYSIELGKRAYINLNEHTVYIHGSESHYAELVSKYGKTTEQLYKQYQQQHQNKEQSK